MIDAKADASTPQIRSDLAPPSYANPPYANVPYPPQNFAPPSHANPPYANVPYPPQNPAPPSQWVPNAAQIGQDYQAQLFARCAQGLHEPTTRYGPCGIITAIFLFPIGLICLFADTERKCSRCGIRL